VVTDARTEPVPIRRFTGVNPVPLIGLSLVVLLIVWLAINLEKTPYEFLSALLIGVTNGSVFGLVALGYTLVYGILELINFAHGDVFMLGGMISITIVGPDVFNLHAGESVLRVWPSIFATLAIAIVGCGLINATVERIAYRPLRGAPRLVPLITAIAASFILQNIALATKGADTVPLNTGSSGAADFLPQGNVFTFGSGNHFSRYTWASLIVVLITLPVLVSLIWLVQRTKQGKAMRATAQDREAAAMMGINVNRTISFTFLLAGGLAGAAGLIYAIYFTGVKFDQGFQLGLIAFTAAVLGGIGNLAGAVLGALMIGMVQSFNNTLAWHAPGSDWTQSIVFAILILILVFRPEGLLGERTPEGG
jgi:branched-chain amino acid transport system permease protein